MAHARVCLFVCLWIDEALTQFGNEPLKNIFSSSGQSSSKATPQSANLAPQHHHIPFTVSLCCLGGFSSSNFQTSTKILHQLTKKTLPNLSRPLKNCTQMSWRFFLRDPKNRLFLFEKIKKSKIKNQKIKIQKSKIKNQKSKIKN